MDEISNLVSLIIIHSKHGPYGEGESGPCDKHCLKCYAISAKSKIDAMRLTINLNELREVELRENPSPISMFLTCPMCSHRHIDEGEFATKLHHTHSCQHCGLTWRPAVVPTVGVQFLPGFKGP